MLMSHMMLEINREIINNILTNKTNKTNAQTAN